MALGPYIVAVLKPDWVEPYAKEGSLIPVVVASSHPKYTPGTRFDYGFMQTAIREGYSVMLLQEHVAMKLRKMGWGI